MFKVWLILRAEVRRHSAILWSYPGDSLSWLLYTCLMFIAAIAILNGVTGGEYGQEEQLLVLVGWLTWQVAGSCLDTLPEAISDEAQTGTLEQVCLSPAPLSLVLAARNIASFLVAGARGLVAALILVAAVGAIPSVNRSGVVLVFFVSLVGACGMGYLFAGLTMVFKRISSLTNLVFSVMIFLTGAFVSLERLGWVFTATRLLFPLTWGISLIRKVMTDSSSVRSLWNSGELGWLCLHSIFYLALGLGVFAWGYRTARRKGTLAHY
ncbi:MAG: ABC transporter permease [Anaerolineae bacterium]|nr:ABC transporter permease [Anaerolineae bacterium]